MVLCAVVCHLDLFWLVCWFAGLLVVVSWERGRIEDLKKKNEGGRDRKVGSRERI